MLAAGTAGTVTGGRLADRFGRLPVTRGSFAVSVLGLLAIVLTPLPWVFPAIAITGFALFQSFSLTVTLGQDYLPNRIGTSSGVTLGLAISIGGLFTPALGALAEGGGEKPADADGQAERDARGRADPVRQVVLAEGDSEAEGVEEREPGDRDGGIPTAGGSARSPAGRGRDRERAACHREPAEPVRPSAAAVPARPQRASWSAPPRRAACRRAGRR